MPLFALLGVKPNDEAEPDEAANGEGKY